LLGHTLLAIIFVVWQWKYAVKELAVVICPSLVFSRSRFLCET